MSAQSAQSDSRSCTKNGRNILRHLQLNGSDGKATKFIDMLLEPRNELLLLYLNEHRVPCRGKAGFK